VKVLYSDNSHLISESDSDILILRVIYTSSYFYMQATMEEELEHWSPRVEMTGRVIGILDMDSFELQIYLKLKYPQNWVQIYNQRPAVLAQSKGNMYVTQ